MTNPYLVESIEHRYGDNVTWRKADRRGYTEDISQAGRYSKQEAEEICKGANHGGKINERCWPEADVIVGPNKHFQVMTVAVYK